ncbi:hypothetical protein GCM10009416_47280 [Craurococcus roseus]|uniref:PAS domain-containing protein n=1 Tax=Craurococcus roseus TaxID=77585 RepID=A0ABP3RBK4_9PROT
MDDEAAWALLNSPFPCALADRGGTLTAINPAAARLLPQARVGRAVAPLLGLDLARLLAEAAAPAPEPLPSLAEAPDGSTAALLAHPFPARGGGLVIGLTDLTAAREAEQRRFEKTPYGTLRLDPKGRVRYANGAARRLFQGPCVGRDFASMFEPAVAEQIRRAFQAAVRTEEAQSVPVGCGFRIVAGALSFPSEPWVTLLPDYAPGGRLVGVLAVVRKRILEALRLQLREAAVDADGPADLRGWADRMRALLDVLAFAVPFDRAYFTCFSRDGAWARPVLAHPGEPWPVAWVPVPPSMRERLRAGHFAFELNELLETDPGLGENPLVARHVADGMVSHFVLPVPFGQPEAALTLASRKPGLFRDGGGGDAEGDASWSSIEDAWPPPPSKAAIRLQLEPPLLALLRQIERHDASVERIGDTAEGAKTVPEATRTLLQGLVEHFGWDHASVFVAERGAERTEFRPFVQYPATDADGGPHPLAIPWSHRQPLYDPAPGEPLDEELARESGMLGAAVRSARHGGSGVVVAADVSDPRTHGKPPHWFRSVSRSQASALTVAITIDGRTRWVLDTVSRHANAFIEEDGARVAALVRRLADRVAALRTAAINETLIELVEQGVVVTDGAGTILRANRSAQGILGLLADRPPDGARLHDHLCPDADGEATRLPEIGHRRTKVRLGPVGGEGHDVWVERFEDSTETRDLVWLLDATQHEAFTHDTRYIQATVEEVARQTRGPLLLASALARRIAYGPQSHMEPVAKAAKKLRAELTKADITFERLAETADVRRAPKREESDVELRELVAGIKDGLPEADAGLIHGPTGEATVAGDRGRLSFALRTLIGHLLARAPDKIDVTLRRSAADGAVLSLRAVCLRPEAPDDEGGELGKAACAAREAAGRSLGTVMAVLRAHGAGFEERQDGYELRFRLPIREALT